MTYEYPYEGWTEDQFREEYERLWRSGNTWIDPLPWKKRLRWGGWRSPFPSLFFRWQVCNYRGECDTYTYTLKAAKKWLDEWYEMGP